MRDLSLMYRKAGTCGFEAFANVSYAEAKEGRRCATGGMLMFTGVDIYLSLKTPACVRSSSVEVKVRFSCAVYEGYLLQAATQVLHA